MLVRILFTCLLCLGALSPAKAQSLESLCLNAVSAGAATVNCAKASYLFQKKQFRLLQDISKRLAQGSARAQREDARNAARLNRKISNLSSLVEVLAKRPRPSESLLIKQPGELVESGIECSDEFECAEELKLKANRLCRQLGFARHKAFGIENKPDNDVKQNINWIVCRS